MDDGTPSRFRYAQELGAMLGTVALLGSDIVEVHMLADGSSYTGARLAAPHLVTELIEEVSELPRGTRTDLAASLRDYRRGAEPADLAVLLTDGLAEERALAEAVSELSGSARGAALVHLVESEAAMAALEGSFELEDRETGETIVVEVTPRIRATYEERVATAAAALRDHCADHGVNYVRGADRRRPARPPLRRRPRRPARQPLSSGPGGSFLPPSFSATTRAPISPSSSEAVSAAPPIVTSTYSVPSIS